MKFVVSISIMIILYACHEKKPLITGFEGKPLPSFNLLLPDSTTYINTANSPKGNPVVLFYFSPECPFWKAQMKDIIGNIASFKNVQFYIFTTWPFQEMKEFEEHYQLNKYSNIVVGVDYKNFFKYYYNVSAVPYTAIYNPDKNLSKAFSGKISSKQINEDVYK